VAAGGLMEKTRRLLGRRTVVSSLLALLLVGVAPAPAEAANTGGGVVTGSVVFGGSGVPPVTSPCRATSFSLTGTSTAMVVNTAISAYVGPVTFSGGGSATCENAAGAVGSLALSATGFNPVTQSTFSCGTLNGIFIRAGAQVVVGLGGNCAVNNLSSPVNFVAVVQFTPDTPGGGAITNVTSASFQGAFSVF
jgi:hypothetical protein